MTRQAVRGRTRRPGPVDGPAAGEGLPGWFWTLDRPKAAADPPDDDFDGPTLDPKWTVVEGAAGTVGLTATGGGVYDLSTRPGWLLLQARQSNQVRLRQDYALPDGDSVVVKLASSLTANAQAGILNNSLNLGLALNNNDSDYNAGNAIHLVLDTNNEGWRILYNNQAGAAKSTPSSANPLVSAPLAESVYFRVLRSGLTYYGFWSADGAAWFSLGSFSYASPLDNLWLIALSFANIRQPTPVQAVDWVRLGGDGVDPW